MWWYYNLMNNPARATHDHTGAVYVGGSGLHSAPYQNDLLKQRGPVMPGTFPQYPSGGPINTGGFGYHPQSWGYSGHHAPTYDNIASGQHAANARYGSNSHLPTNPNHNKSHGPTLHPQYHQQYAQYPSSGCRQQYRSSGAPMYATGASGASGGFGQSGASQGAVYATAGGGRGDGGGSMYVASR